MHAAFDYGRIREIGILRPARTKKLKHVITQLKNLSPHERANDTGIMLDLALALTVQAIANRAD